MNSTREPFKLQHFQSLGPLTIEKKESVRNQPASSLRDDNVSKLHSEFEGIKEKIRNVERKNQEVLTLIRRKSQQQPARNQKLEKDLCSFKRSLRTSQCDNGLPTFQQIVYSEEPMPKRRGSANDALAETNIMRNFDCKFSSEKDEPSVTALFHQIKKDQNKRKPSQNIYRQPASSNQQIQIKRSELQLPSIQLMFEKYKNDFYFPFHNTISNEFQNLNNRLQFLNELIEKLKQRVVLKQKKAEQQLKMMRMKQMQSLQFLKKLTKREEQLKKQNARLSQQLTTISQQRDTLSQLHQQKLSQNYSEAKQRLQKLQQENNQKQQKIIEQHSKIIKQLKNQLNKALQQKQLSLIKQNKEALSQIDNETTPPNSPTTRNSNLTSLEDFAQISPALMRGFTDSEVKQDYLSINKKQLMMIHAKLKNSEKLNNTLMNRLKKQRDDLKQLEENYQSILERKDKSYEELLKKKNELSVEAKVLGERVSFITFNNSQSDEKYQQLRQLMDRQTKASETRQQLLKANFFSVETKNIKLQLELRKIKDKNSALQSQIDEIKRKIQLLHIKKNEETSKLKSELVNQRNNCRSERQKQNRHLQTIREQAELLRQTRMAMEHQIEVCRETDSQKYLDIIRAKDEEISQWMAKYEEIKAELDQQLEAKSDLVRSKDLSLEKAISNFKQQLFLMDENLKGAREELEYTQIRQKQRVRDLEEQLLLKSQELDRIYTELASRNDEVQNLLEHCESLQKKESAEQQLNKEKQLKNWIQRYNEIKLELDQMENKSPLKEENARLSQKIEEMEAEERERFVVIEREYLKMQADMIRLEDENKMMKEELKKAGRMSEKYVQQNMQIKKLVSIIEKKDRQVIQIQDRLKKLSQSNKTNQNEVLSNSVLQNFAIQEPVQLENIQAIKQFQLGIGPLQICAYLGILKMQLLNQIAHSSEAYFSQSFLAQHNSQGIIMLEQLVAELKKMISNPRQQVLEELAFIDRNDFQFCTEWQQQLDQIIIHPFSSTLTFSQLPQQ